MENPTPYEDGLVAPPDNASPYYAARGNSVQSASSRSESLKATLMNLARDTRKERSALHGFDKYEQEMHSDLVNAAHEDESVGHRVH